MAVTDTRANSVLLVRDVMTTIGVPVCRASESCGPVAARLSQETSRVSETGEVCVVLDDDGCACGWLTRQALAAATPALPVSEVAVISLRRIERHMQAIGAA